MRWWLRSLAAGAGAGLIVGIVIGGTLGRVFMRLVFLARRDTLGVETAMGAVIGEFTRGGTGAIYAFAGFAGVALGAAYAATRAVLPQETRARTTIFTTGTTAFMLGQIVLSNREDFTLLPVTLSLLLIAISVALTAAPIPLIVEWLTPDHRHHRGRFAHALVFLGMSAFVVFGSYGILTAYTM